MEQRLSGAEMVRETDTASTFPKGSDVGPIATKTGHLLLDPLEAQTLVAKTQIGHKAIAIVPRFVKQVSRGEEAEPVRSVREVAVNTSFPSCGSSRD